LSQYLFSEGRLFESESLIHRYAVTIFNAGIKQGTMHLRCIMETTRKITVEISSDLLEKAQRVSGTGITQTVRTGPQLVAAAHTYARLQRLRGKVRFTRTLVGLKADR
jgi:hypothetical protein